MERFVPVHPFHRPACLLLDDIDIRNGIEEIIFLIWILDVGVDQKRVGLGMDIFHGDLEPVETASLRNLNLRAKLLG